MINGFKLTIYLLFYGLLFACSNQDMPEPSCRVNAKHASSYQGAGACVVRLSNKLLVTQLQSGLYDLPSAKEISNNGKLVKSAQCLAHQAMWQHTGLNVEVQQVVATQADGTWLFACSMNAGFDGSEAPFETPSWSPSDIKYVAFINPFEIDLHNWAKRDQFNVVRDAYILSNVKQSVHDQ